MTWMTLDRVGVEFRILNAHSRSLKATILRRPVGGRIGSAADGDPSVITALENITLDVRAGERVGLIGHNGAGKSTLLRVLAGIYHPTSGTIAHRGRRMGLLNLTQGIDGDATGYENIMLRGLVMGLTREEIMRARDDIIEQSGLGDFINLPIRTYSSGMTLRLLFSIATAVQPEILLMDEWIGTADRDFTAIANNRLREIIAAAGILVLASHDLALLAEMCTRGVLMSQGAIVAEGPIGEVIEIYRRGE